MVTLPAWLLIVILILLFLSINWRRVFRKTGRLTLFGALALITLLLCGLTLYLFVPGVGKLGVHLQSWFNPRGLLFEVLSSESGGATQSGEILIVHTRVTNTGREPTCISPGSFELRDWQGRRFVGSVAPIPWGFGSINPGLSIDITLAFEVPSTRGLWWVTLYPDCRAGKDGLTTPVVVR